MASPGSALGLHVRRISGRDEPAAAGGFAKGDAVAFLLVQSPGSAGWVRKVLVKK